MRAASYSRASTEEQVTEGHSLDAQRHSTRRFIESHGWTLVHEYVDAGLSAKRDSERPALEQLLRDAVLGRFDVVVVDKVDRFYRHLQGLLSALDQLNDHGVTFVSVRENLDFSTPWGKLALTVLGMLAEIYIDNLREETKKGKRARARKGLWNGSIPLGYCRGLCSRCDDPNGEGYCPSFGQADRNPSYPGVPLVAHPIESIAVTLAFTWYAVDQRSDAEVADRLNTYRHQLPDGREVELRTKGILGRYLPGPFSKSAVREILMRRFYTGEVVYYGTDDEGRKRKRNDFVYTVQGRHPTLVSKELFDQVQELRCLTGHHNRGEQGTPRLYPLSGILRCAGCERRMWGFAANQGIRYYRDSTRAERRGECEQMTVHAEEVEDQVVDLLRRCRLPDDWEERIVEFLHPPDDRAEVREQEHRWQERLARAQELYLAGDISRDRYLEEKWAAQIALTSLHPVPKDVMMAAGSYLQDFDRLWSEAHSYPDKARLLRVAVAAAFVKGRSLVALQPTESFFPLMHYCWSGSDGIRTRDLRLDRPTCLPLHYAPKCESHYTMTLPVRQITWIQKTVTPLGRPAASPHGLRRPSPGPPGTRCPLLLSLPGCAPMLHLE
jgi:DNA invertase Pin-like site-specific DNA recombinase